MAIINEKNSNSKKKKKMFNKEVIKYIETIVYILAIIVAIFACNCGIIYIKMLPILFILGFVGKIIFDRPVVTTIFGIVTAICIIEITTNLNFFDNFFISLCDGINIALGELFGEYFLKSKKNFCKKKKINKKKVLYTYISTVVIFLISIGIHLYTNGDYISYFKARKSLYTYLNNMYIEDSFNIVNCKYTFYKTKSYNFEVRNKTKNINTNFIVLRSKDYLVYDEYKFKVESKNNIKLNYMFNEYMNLFNTDLDFKIGYLDSSKIKIKVSKSVESVNEYNTNNFCNEITKFILYLKDFEYYSKINDIEISLIDKSNNTNTLISDLILEDMKKKDNIYNYILDSLTVEFID